jgi:prolyl-tRNA editing enzyme YbaK/EbsC (Cys-tRNA(Pro) deacylase)
MMAEWPEPVERVAAVLRSAGVEARIEELPHGTPTARAAADALGCELGQIVKSVVLVCDGAYVLALVPGDRRAGEAAVAGAVGAASARLARPEEVIQATGFEPGGVAPFPHRAVTDVLLDNSLLGQTAVWIGAGTTDHMALITSVDLQRLARARLVDLTQPG